MKRLNRSVSLLSPRFSMLREKGFGVAGDEPLSVRVNRHLRLGQGKEV